MTGGRRKVLDRRWRSGHCLLVEQSLQRAARREDREVLQRGCSVVGAAEELCEHIGWL